jgi:hypothetical protein
MGTARCPHLGPQRLRLLSSQRRHARVRIARQRQRLSELRSKGRRTSRVSAGVLGREAPALAAAHAASLLSITHDSWAGQPFPSYLSADALQPLEAQGERRQP